LPLKKDNGWALFAGLDGIRAGERAIGDLGLLFTVREGGFETRKLKAALEHGGVIEGAAQMTGGRFHANARGKKIDYANFVSGLKGGDARTDIMIESRGGNFMQMRAHMEGHFMMVGGE